MGDSRDPIKRSAGIYGQNIDCMSGIVFMGDGLGYRVARYEYPESQTLNKSKLAPTSELHSAAATRLDRQYVKCPK